MSNDVAVDPQGELETRNAELETPQAWREHVRELRSENARRRKENQELREQLAALEARASKAEDAQAAAAERAQGDAARLGTAQRRLKLLELGRLTREALAEAAARRERPTGDGGADVGDTEVGGTGVPPVTPAPTGKMPVPPCQVDMAKAQRLLERVPSPVDVEGDLMVDEEGQVTLEAAAAERLRAYVEELAELASTTGKMPVPPTTGKTPVSPVAPPPVGGEPPRAPSQGAGRLRNSWDSTGPRSAAGRSPRRVAPSTASVEGV